MKDKLVMVVKRSLLFGKDIFEGYRAKNEIDYESRILKDYYYLQRSIAEDDFNCKQPISYALLVNPEEKKVFAYQRAKKDYAYAEKRLQGKWSWGLGGHIENNDGTKGNPMHYSMLRELEEEVEFSGISKIDVLGYLNDDSDNVGKVHFGILYIVETQSKSVKPNDLEIAQGELKTISELEDISKNYDVESWSEFAFKPLKEYLDKS